MATWTMQDKVCCSCRYWSGSRTIDFMAVLVKVYQRLEDVMVH